VEYTLWINNGIYNSFYIPLISNPYLKLFVILASMWFFLQLKRNQNDLNDFLRIRLESRFHLTFVQDSGAQRVFDQECLRPEKTGK